MIIVESTNIKNCNTNNYMIFLNNRHLIKNVRMDSNDRFIYDNTPIIRKREYKYRKRLDLPYDYKKEYDNIVCYTPNNEDGLTIQIYPSNNKPIESLKTLLEYVKTGLANKSSFCLHKNSAKKFKLNKEDLFKLLEEVFGETDITVYFCNKSIR